MLPQLAANPQNNQRSETEKVRYVASKCHSKRTPTWSHRMHRAIFTYSLRVHFSSQSCTQMTKWMRGRTPGAAGGPINTHQATAIQGVRVLSG